MIFLSNFLVLAVFAIGKLFEKPYPGLKLEQKAAHRNFYDQVSRTRVVSSPTQLFSAN